MPILANTMHAPQIDLRPLRETVRRGNFAEGALEMGKRILLATKTQPNSKSHLQALSLTVEIARELGHYEDAEGLIRHRAMELVNRLRSEDISSRIPRNSHRTETEYQLVRQEIWCVLAYARICDDLGRRQEGLKTLALIETEIQKAVEAPDWPEGLKFRGTRARLEYYYGLMLRSQPCDALRHFRSAIDFVWERWEQQRGRHPADSARLRIEYEYALDSVARVMTFGYAFTFMVQTRLSDASAMLRTAALVADQGPNKLLQLVIASLLCHVRRHENGYQPKLNDLLKELRAISQQLRGHPTHWARAMFEAGLTLIALLRSSDRACLEMRARYVKELKYIIDQLSNDAKELSAERTFQVNWLCALQSEAQGRFLAVDDPASARREFEAARRSLSNLQEVSTITISPLQHWEGQRWIITALVEIELGNFLEAEALLNRGRQDWESGPTWLVVLARARYAAVAAMRGQFERARDLLRDANELARPVFAEFAWVLNELQLAEDRVKRIQHEFDEVTSIIRESVKPAEKVRLILRELLQTEFERQRGQFPNLKSAGNEEKWYPDIAAQNLGCGPQQLREWLIFAGLSFAAPEGRPPTQVSKQRVRPLKRPAPGE